MKVSRRDFLKKTLLLAGGLMCSDEVLSAAPLRTGAWRPAYAMLEADGNLKTRIDQAYAIFRECVLCPRQCGVNRLKREQGFCRAPAEVVVYSAHPHFGEERSLVGRHGSGTIFFSNCNLRCVFCQNWPISHEGHGREIEDEDLARYMLDLQEIGCHNINLVTPTHVMPNILNATRIALEKGLNIPLVYNTSGYERVEMLRLLAGVVDIYLPDMKYMDPEMAATYSAGAADYPQMTQQAILEMQRQVGEHMVDNRGVALHGLMIRHLIMPNGVAGTEAFIRWLSQKLPKSTYVNLMAQYHVDYKAYDYPEICRRITVREFLESMAWAEQRGLTNLDPDSVMLKEFYQRQEKLGK